MSITGVGAGDTVVQHIDKVPKYMKFAVWEFLQGFS